MPSAVARGSYWKARSKRWLETQGEVVGFMERMLHVQGQHGLIPVKRDQLGADLIAVSRFGTKFIQCKGGATWRSGLAAARAEFAKYPLGPGAEQHIHGWDPGAHHPEVLIVAVGPCDAQHPVLMPARRRPKPLPLFTRPA